MSTNKPQAQTGAKAQQSQAFLLPAVDVMEDANGITLYSDMPGVSKDKIELHIEADTLTIEGEVDLNIPPSLDVSHIEVTLPRYRRAFTLSKELDVDQVNAKFDQGVLTLRIPKAQHAQPRQIQVQVG